MIADVYSGKLIHVNTDEGRAELTGHDRDVVQFLDITFLNKHPWKNLIGEEVEAIVIDGKTTDVRCVPPRQEY
jgi:hypothetical protein